MVRGIFIAMAQLVTIKSCSMYNFHNPAPCLLCFTND